MSLNGFDIALEIGRSAMNKMLAALEQSPLWVGDFAGDFREPGPRDTTGHVKYHATLSNPRVQGDREQSAALESSIEFLVDVNGEATIETFLDSQLMFDHNVAIDGSLSVVVHFKLVQAGEGWRLVISFQQAQIQHLILKGIPDAIRRMLAAGLCFVLEAELRQRQQDLPLTGLLGLSGAPQGAPEQILLKSHFYRTLPSDIAVGVAATFAPGAVPISLHKPLDLVRAMNQDLVLSAQEDYLNRMIANGIHDMEKASFGGGLFGDRLREPSLVLRSASIRIEKGQFFVTARIGDSDTELAAQAAVAPSVVNNRLLLDVRDVDVRIPTWKGVAAQIVLNVVAWLILEIVEDYGRHAAEPQLHDAGELGSGLVVDKNVFSQMPDGLSIASRLEKLNLHSGNVSLGYSLDVNWLGVRRVSGRPVERTSVH